VTDPNDDWSPADHPYAIAVSEAQWWARAVQLAVLRLGDEDDDRLQWFSSRQIDARQMIFSLRQLLSAEKLQQVAMGDLGMDQDARDALSQVRQRFEDALPGIKDMRDGLMHFEDWARGKGGGPQKLRRAAGATLRDVAREFWSFGFEPGRGTVSFGPYRIDIGVADKAAEELAHAIYLAAHAVDRRDAAQLRDKVIATLKEAGLPAGPASGDLLVSSGNDLRVWLSIRTNEDTDAVLLRALANHAAAALAGAQIQLIVPNQAEPADVVEQLVGDRAVQCKASA
jgi:hypothetical protein